MCGNNCAFVRSHLPSLTFLTRCIKESLRIYPSVPTVVRSLNKDIHVEGKTILKGKAVVKKMGSY